MQDYDYAQKNLLGYAAASPAPTALVGEKMSWQNGGNRRR